MISLRADFADLASLIASHERAPEITMEELARLASTTSADLQQRVQEKTPRATSTLAESIISETRRLTNGFGVEGIVSTSLAHAPYIELGTGPAVGRPKYMPPLAPLIAWVRDIKKDLGVSGTGKRAKKSREDAAVAFAKSVQWKIYHHGTEGRHMFEEGFKEALPDINAHAAAAARRIAARLAGGEA